MEFLQLPFTTLIYYILPFLAALLVIVFVHEFGHYYVARLCGVGVESFSIGFGKEVIGWRDSRGTRWKICWLPLGGYVKFEGDSNAASLPTNSESPRSPTNFHGKPVWQRAAIVAAGPIANFLLGILIFSMPPFLYGEPVLAPVVGEIRAGSAAETAGLKVGDRIVSIDATPITSFSQIPVMILDTRDKPLLLKVERGGNTLEITATPSLEREDDKIGGKMSAYRLGLGNSQKPEHLTLVKHSLPSALGKGVSQTWQVVSTTVKFLGRLFTGHENVEQLRGMPRLAQAAGNIAAFGLLAFVSFIGLISVSIGLINLFPIPMLDGGHLVFYGIEALRGKPLGKTTQEWSFRVGVTLVLMAFLFATVNDVFQLTR
jgi:regulator of sigma E protease